MIKQMTIARLESWLENNIEKLNLKFKSVDFNPELRKRYEMRGRKYFSKEFQEQLLKKALLDYAELILSKDYQKLRKHKIKKFRKLCDPLQPYEQKIYSLDKIIETTYQSFDLHLI